MCYQGTFCIITAALISGAIVERMRFSAYVTFITLWALVVYTPIAHWVWGGGFLSKMGALDFAGGTVVHVNAGVAALVAAFLVGKRRDYPRLAVPPGVPFTLLGAGVLWFGWFVQRRKRVAPTGSLRWRLPPRCWRPAGFARHMDATDIVRTGKPTAVGCATAIVVGPWPSHLRRLRRADERHRIGSLAVPTTSRSSSGPERR
jgi:Amt family ammonium transporter